MFSSMIRAFPKVGSAACVQWLITLENGSTAEFWKSLALTSNQDP